MPERVTLGQGSDVDASTSRAPGRLAYSSVQFEPDIWVLTPPSRQAVQVTRTPNDEDYPHESPDGSQLLLMSDRGGDDTALWMLDLTHGTWSRVDTGQKFYETPRWSPDGKRIAYTGRSDDGSRIAMVQEVGGLATRELALEGIVGVGTPEWSRDGRSLAVVGNDGEGLGDIWITDLDGGSRRITTIGGAFPTFSPDGDSIAFHRQKDGPRQIWVVPTTGGEPRQVTNDQLEYSHPQWHPTDPDRVLAVVNHKNLAVVSVSTGRIDYLTDYDESTIALDYPTWSHDGKKIYFSVARKTGDVFLLEDY